MGGLFACMTDTCNDLARAHCAKIWTKPYEERSARFRLVKARKMLHNINLLGGKGTHLASVAQARAVVLQSEEHRYPAPKNKQMIIVSQSVQT